ncbi:MAG: hypothetical protein JWN30_1199 [Bacilli bacterium]|nr:hypothetical protein [Bacilli bacterium]
MDERVQAVKDRVHEACLRARRPASEVTIVAVSKYSDVSGTGWFLEQGMSHLGENRLQAAQPKLDAFPQAIWHYIGSLQTRKVREVVQKFAYIHSVDRIELAEEINRRCEGLANQPGCFLQVNLSGESTKGGFTAGELRNFVRSISTYVHLQVIGLMTIAPQGASDDECRTLFRGLRELRDEVRLLGEPASRIRELSMGMSQDFEIAIEEGATFVRLGSVFLNQ